MNFISSFLRIILDAIVGVVGNYGVAILLITLLIKLVLLPLDIRQKQSAHRMSMLQPKVDALKKKYANDNETFTKKQMELWKAEKVNPLAGCLPTLLTLPILWFFFSMLRVLANEQSVQTVLMLENGQEVVHQGFLWIKNIWQPDSFFAAVIPQANNLSAIAPVAGSSILTSENIELVKAFVSNEALYTPLLAQAGGLIKYSLPLLIWTLNIPEVPNGFFILPILAGFTSYLSAALMPQQPSANGNDAGASMTKMMKYFFPVMSLWICATSNAGFSLYWVFSNVFAIVEQYLLSAYFKRKYAADPLVIEKKEPASRSEVRKEARREAAALAEKNDDSDTKA